MTLRKIVPVMLDRIERIQQRIEPLRQELLAHPIYAEMKSLAALQQFMQQHVFAVWDFMSLLKVLQRRLCCVEVPWLAPADGLTARFINEIVLGEESDEDGHGGYASHFELYHRSMRGCGADTGGIDRFLALLRRGVAVERALAEAETPRSVRQFVQHTFAVIESGELAAIASAFTFGREELLPAVFQRIVDELNVASSGGLADFEYYLQRHIALDGDSHGPLAARLLQSLCGEDEQQWQTAEAAAVRSLQARKDLWDGMLAACR